MSSGDRISSRRDWSSSFPSSACSKRHPNSSRSITLPGTRVVFGPVSAGVELIELDPGREPSQPVDVAGDSASLLDLGGNRRWYLASSASKRHATQREPGGETLIIGFWHWGHTNARVRTSVRGAAQVFMSGCHRGVLGGGMGLAAEGTSVLTQSGPESLVHSPCWLSRCWSRSANKVRISWSRD